MIDRFYGIDQRSVKLNLSE